jgi:hypothetical protein
MDELDERIDFDIMRARWWHEPDEVRSARQAEFLVHGVVPWEYVAFIVVMNEDVAEEVRSVIHGSGSTHTPEVVVLPPGRSTPTWPCGYYY